MMQEAATPKVERRLAAIVAADVVGYSRLMGVDEEGTLDRLKGHRRELVDPKIAEHRGHIVKTTGDGMLVEFVSPVEAVRCAVEIQRGMVTRNAGVPPEKRIAFRVGITLGDVIAEKGDLFGDSVNVAARLQTLAEPGSIAISRVMRDSIRDKLPFVFEDTGEQEVKNIVRPVRVYALTGAAVEGLPEPQSTPPQPAVDRSRIASIRVIAGAAASVVLIAAGLWWSRSSDLTFFQSLISAPADKPATLAVAVPPSAALAKLATQTAPRMSIVVLPFTNLSGDAALEYFADGFTGNLTTDVCQIATSFVIARTTAFTYKGKVLSAQEIAKELNVRYVLEGGIQKTGNHVRVNAQLIDGATGGHLWAEIYDRDSADLLQIEDEITKQIANTLNHRLVVVESERSWRDHPTDPDSLDLTLRADAMSQQTAKSNADARRLYERAVELDAQNVGALIGLGFTYLTEVQAEWLTGTPGAKDEALKRADDAATRALSINPRAASAYALKSGILAYMTENDYRGEIAQAIAAAETALEINPNRPGTLVWLGRLYSKAGHPERTAALVEQAIRLNPVDANAYQWALGMAQLQMGHNEEAIDIFQRTVLTHPNEVTSWGALTGAFIAAGRDVEAQTALVKWREVTASQRSYMPDYPPDRDVLYVRVQLALIRLGRWPYSIVLWKLISRPGGDLWGALLKFQADENLPQSGQPDEATLARLGIAPLASTTPSK